MPDLGRRWERPPRNLNSTIWFSNLKMLWQKTFDFLVRVIDKWVGLVGEKLIELLTYVNVLF